MTRPSLHEIVVISGKGGTGKTSLLAAFATLAGDAVLADCDVDAANLHLLLSPRRLQRHEFWAGHEASIRDADCDGCGTCREVCRFDAVRRAEPGSGAMFRIDPSACEGCGVCVRLCPRSAIDYEPRLCGHWMISDTRVGRLVHARLGVGGENSGRLVSVVRNEARSLAESTGASLLLTDGPPGIGCPVIASLSGADLAVVVTEPTVSGAHDLERVLGLTRHFSIPAAVCINKWDINAAMTERIEGVAHAARAQVVGRLPYARSATEAQRRSLTLVEAGGPLALEARKIWGSLVEMLVPSVATHAISLPVRHTHDRSRREMP